MYWPVRVTLPELAMTGPDKRTQPLDKASDTDAWARRLPQIACHGAQHRDRRISPTMTIRKVRTVFVEKCVLHHYPFIGDRLVIGRFCAIAEGAKFIMNGANHAMSGFSTYPFNIFGHGWEKGFDPATLDEELRGDTIVGNDVWIGMDAVVLPGMNDRRRRHHRRQDLSSAMTCRPMRSSPAIPARS